VRGFFPPLFFQFLAAWLQCCCVLKLSSHVTHIVRVWCTLLQAPFAPPPQECLAAPSDAAKRAALTSLLDKLPSILSDPQAAAQDSNSYAVSACASQAALLAAVDLIHSNGGKVNTSSVKQICVPAQYFSVRQQHAMPRSLGT
jgi:hypothetical protein